MRSRPSQLYDVTGGRRSFAAETVSKLEEWIVSMCPLTHAEVASHVSKMLISCCCIATRVY